MRKLCSKRCFTCIIWFDFKKTKNKLRVLLNISSKINSISLVYTKKLDFKVWKTNIWAKKIFSYVLEIFEIVIADFYMEDKVSRPRFFYETFLVADIKFEIILGMFFLKISNADVLFGENKPI